MADYGGMRPTYIYDPEADPEVQKYNRILETLSAFGPFMEAINRPERELKKDIVASELNKIQALGLNPDVEQFFDDEEYRQQWKDKETVRRDIANKAYDFVPDADFQVFSPVLLSYKTVYDSDISPAVFEGADLKVARKILIEGDQDINEPAIMNLSWEDINAFPGMSDELIRLGLLQENEATPEGWEKARTQLPDRFEWFSVSLKSGTPSMQLGRNETFAVNESEINKIVAERISLAQGRVNAVKESHEYQDMMKANERWTSEKAQTIGYIVDENQAYAVGEEYGNYGVQMHWQDFVEKYRDTAWAYGQSIENIAELAMSDNPAVQKQWNEMKEGLREESTQRGDSFYSQLMTRINQYNAGMSKYRQINRDLELEAFTSMELTEQARRNMEDMDDINSVITPIGQHVSYLTAIREGLLPIDQIDGKYLNEDGTININAVDVDLDRTAASFEEYKNHITILYDAQETNFSPVHINAQLEMAIQKSKNVILQTKDEKKFIKQDKERNAYMDALRDIEHNNLWGNR